MESLNFDNETFVSLLTELIALSEKLQNNPPFQVPQEDLAADVVCKFLEPFTAPNGPLVVRKRTFVAGRSNVILEYNPAHNQRIVSLVGSHLDVVPANPEEWSVDPFSLTRDGDKLSGRGVTDCLGHVAMITLLFQQLALHQPKLSVGVKALFIASEENDSIAGVGIEEMAARHELDEFKDGPLIWVDSANFGPTLGTAAALQWEITCFGKLFHSGLPHKAINAIELAAGVISYLQKRFYEDFPAGEQEKEYKFLIGSSLKATQISVPRGGLNQIPGQCTIAGDIRLTPFHDVEHVMRTVERYVAECDVNALPAVGYSAFELPEEGIKAKIELKWLGDAFPGIACDLESAAFQALRDAIVQVTGKDSSFSLTGSLPLVGDLKKAGFDVQVCGFGRMEAYHAVDEYGMVSEFAQGFTILSKVISSLNSQ